MPGLRSAGHQISIHSPSAMAASQRAARPVEAPGDHTSPRTMRGTGPRLSEHSRLPRRKGARRLKPVRRPAFPTAFNTTRTASTAVSLRVQPDPTGRPVAAARARQGHKSAWARTARGTAAGKALPSPISSGPRSPENAATRLAPPWPAIRRSVKNMRARSAGRAHVVAHKICSASDGQSVATKPRA